MNKKTFDPFTSSKSAVKVRKNNSGLEVEYALANIGAAHIGITFLTVFLRAILQVGLLANIFGGVSLVAALGHAQVLAGRR